MRFKGITRGPAYLKAAGVAAIAAAFVAPGALFAQAETLAISGQLTYRERIALPPEAVARIRIEDVSRADVLADTVFETELAAPAVPVPFALDVPRTRMQDRGRYGLRAGIVDQNGALLWTTDTFIPIDPAESKADLGTIVMTRVAVGGTAPQIFLCGETPILTVIDGDELLLTRPGNTSRLSRERTASGARFAGENGALSFWLKGEEAQLSVDGATQGCTTTTPGRFLTGGEWNVEDIDGGGVIDQSRSTIAFGSDGRLWGLAGCNRYIGEWQAKEASFEASRVVRTRKACVPALARQEVEFLDSLSGATDFTFTPTGALIISSTNGRRIIARRN